ncbi:PadR family transcriptional regulator [Ornithinibacillus sp. L9]|uniref:PadR family transcriptional regulator n=1 Tax=Ornithinibacillus caprae TaxID=2678566 RepID=A0A6N8FNT1_9BACI|nr:PadR family transcriptional regulator [Ornithinibacillus caprae]MUK90506.1 PadR family transcriptional regulator [Ornithinibacillus caprae]
MRIDKWELQLRKGIIELAIMLFVKHRALYGYQITKTLNDIPELKISEGSIYPILKRLESNRWLYSYWDEPESGPRRKYYQLTDKGWITLEKRLEIFNSSANIINSLEKGGN